MTTMTSSPYATRRRSGSMALLREGLAVAFIMAGLVGLVVTGFWIGPKVGVGVLSFVLLAVGGMLSYSRDPADRDRAPRY